MSICPICKEVIETKYKISDFEGKATDWEQCFCLSISHANGVDKKVFNKEYREKWEQMKEGKERHQYLMKTYLPLIEDLTYGRKFLDVGFTVTYHIKELAERGWIATGIDLIENEYITGNFEDYDFGDTTFDFILLGHVLESFDDPKEAIRKAYKLLNKYGILMITHPSPELVFKTTVRNFGHWVAEEKHIFISKQELERIGSEAGFTSVLMRRNVSPRYIAWNDLHCIWQKNRV